MWADPVVTPELPQLFSKSALNLDETASSPKFNLFFTRKKYLDEN